MIVVVIVVEVVVEVGSAEKIDSDNDYESAEGSSS